MILTFGNSVLYNALYLIKKNTFEHLLTVKILHYLQEVNIVKRIIKQTERCFLSTWTTSWDLSWAFLTQESCLVPGRVSLHCSLPLAPLVLTYLRSSRLPTCHTYPHKWCPEGPCSLQTGSECLCPSLLVALLFIGILPWSQQAWMMEKECILEMELRGFHIQFSTEEGGRSFLFFEGYKWILC